MNILECSKTQIFDQLLRAHNDGHVVIIFHPVIEQDKKKIKDSRDIKFPQGKWKSAK